MPKYDTTIRVLRDLQEQAKQADSLYHMAARCKRMADNFEQTGYFKQLIGRLRADSDSLIQTADEMSGALHSVIRREIITSAKSGIESA